MCHSVDSGRYSNILVLRLHVPINRRGQFDEGSPISLALKGDDCCKEKCDDRSPRVFAKE